MAKRYFLPLGRFFTCVRADAATALTAAGVLGLLSSFAALLATLAEVFSLADFFAVAMAWSFRRGVGVDADDSRERTTAGQPVEEVATSHAKNFCPREPRNATQMNWEALRA
jgi:hypothetical protein